MDNTRLRSSVFVGWALAKRGPLNHTLSPCTSSAPNPRWRLTTRRTEERATVRETEMSRGGGIFPNWKLETEWRKKLGPRLRKG